MVLIQLSSIQKCFPHLYVQVHKYLAGVRTAPLCPFQVFVVAHVTAGMVNLTRHEKEKYFLTPSGEKELFPSLHDPHSRELSVVIPAYNEELRSEWHSQDLHKMFICWRINGYSASSSVWWRKINHNVQVTYFTLHLQLVVDTYKCVTVSLQCLWCWMKLWST